jgi:hypothetical protein
MTRAASGSPRRRSTGGDADGAGSCQARGRSRRSSGARRPPGCPARSFVREIDRGRRRRPGGRGADRSRYQATTSLVDPHGDWRGEAAMLAEERRIVREESRYWWVLLVSGIAWVLIAWIVLRLNQTSITTVGVLIGVVFIVWVGFFALFKGSRSCSRSASVTRARRRRPLPRWRRRQPDPTLLCRAGRRDGGDGRDDQIRDRGKTSIARADA